MFYTEEELSEEGEEERKPSSLPGAPERREKPMLALGKKENTTEAEREERDLNSTRGLSHCSGLAAAALVEGIAGTGRRLIYGCSMAVRA